MDLDADAKLNLKEFIDAVRPLENFTKNQSTKKIYAPTKRSQKIRPKSSIVQANRQVSRNTRQRSSYNNIGISPSGLSSGTGFGNQNRSILKKSTTQMPMSEFGSPGTEAAANETFNNGSPGGSPDAPGDNRNAMSMIFVCREVIQEVLDMESNIESQRRELSYRQDFSLGAAF
jgi:hypothetical protein